MYEKLKTYRSMAGYTQKEMAERLGISESYYNKMENGNSPMKLETALEISKILKKKPNTIFLGSDMTKRQVKEVGKDAVDRS